MKNTDSANKKQANFLHGNYHAYYGKRKKSEENFNDSSKIESDPRLKYLAKEWFCDKEVLDIGCNVGHVTLSIARDFEPRKVMLVMAM